ncbi:hypothetical protein KC19_6G019900 [Ceratodon purpureus]|uniref:TIR domain-containing protein n=1 Tax=Ceratodon purpureus TaxID=3225 RepID=A0A8T0HE76_CERPU|nr:hypothetical protein KC19_6G019900 [Ceratodon purpureus]
MISIPSTSAAGSRHPKYEIFINHRGTDVKLNFVAHLADALRERHYNPFVDKYDLEKGGMALAEIQAALEGASVQLAVFSPGYAGSEYCLDELVDMLECCKRDEGNVMLVPIFFGVLPEDLERPDDGAFKVAFQKHESSAVCDNRIRAWKKALMEATQRTGFDLRHEAGDENVLMHKIICRVESILSARVDKKQLLSFHVGLETVFASATRELEKMTDKVGALGIWGMGGIGKTTLAKVLYNHYSERFGFHIFLNGGGQVENMDKGWFQKVNGRKVLIVVDDISSEAEFSKLVPSLRNLAKGSCLILTSREHRVMKSIMRDAQASCLLEMEVLSPEDSYKLFCYHAFESREHPKKSDDFFPLSKKVVDGCNGLPLALEIIGKHLFEKDKMVWTEASEILKISPGISRILRISYDGLSDSEKMMFLDVSCQMAGLLEDDAIDIWKSCGEHCWPPECLTSKIVHDSLSILKDKALVKVDGNSRLFVGHDLLQDLGRELAGRDPVSGRMRQLGRHSHLWDWRLAERVLNTGKGTQEIRGLSLVGVESDKVFDASKFDKLTEIHLLQLSRARIEGDFSKWSTNIRWLDWTRSSLVEVPCGLHILYLTHLDLSHSWKLTRLWSQDDNAQVPRFLKVLNLLHCISLKEIPENIKFLTMLKRLNLGHCSNLKTLPSSIGQLTALENLDLTNCKLENLPRGIVDLCSLKIFRVDWCYKLTTLPKDFGNLVGLVTFSAESTGLSCLPDSFSKLSLLEEMSLKDCYGFLELPSSVKGLLKLRLLNLCGTALKKLPTDFGDLEHLEELNLQLCKNLVDLPKNFGSLKSLRFLDFGRCRTLQTLCSNFGQLVSLVTLDLTNCQVRDEDVLQSFGGLCCLSTLVMQGSHLTQLPEDFKNLTTLVHLDMRQSLALVVVGSLPTSLEVLDLRDCPSLKGVLVVEHLIKLKRLVLRNCHGLTAIRGLEHMQPLEEINVSGCWNLEAIDDDNVAKSNVKKYNCDRNASHQRKSFKVWKKGPISEGRQEIDIDIAFAGLQERDMLEQESLEQEFWNREVRNRKVRNRKIRNRKVRNRKVCSTEGWTLAKTSKQPSRHWC